MADPLQPAPIDVPQTPQPDGLLPQVWQAFFLSLRKVATLWQSQPFLTYKATTNLTGAQNLGLLVTGYLKATVAGAVATLSSIAHIPVADGGTGAASFTAHGVLVGEGTSAIAATVAGATGTVLTGVSSADPMFSNNQILSATGAKLTVTTNVAALPAPSAGTLIQVGTVDGGVTRLMLDAFGSTNQFIVRRANGIASALSALVLDDFIGSFIGLGFGATTYVTTNSGYVAFKAAENWSDTQRGTYLAFATTTIGASGSGVERMRISSLGVAINTVTQANALDVNGSVALGTYAGTAGPSNGLIVSGNTGIGTTTPNYAGYTAPALTVQSTGQTGTEIVTTRADADGVALGNYAFRWNTITSADKEVAVIQINSQGTTANNRGGQFLFRTKIDGGVLMSRVVIDNVGHLGIGAFTPTASVHIQAGTAAASTAPLKLTSGTLLTSPEAGAIEFLTDAYYGTQTTGPTRKQFAMIDAASVGAPGEMAKIDSLGLTANVAASTLYVVPATGEGFYRVNAYVVETIAGSVSSVLPNVQIIYTDNDSNVSVTIDATPILGAAGLGQTGALNANAGGTVSSGVIVIYVKASTTIQYSTSNYASVAAGMTYALRIRLELL